jgi:hypothetical protein
VISTEDFVDSIEHMSQASLEEFAEQYIYGTGIPRIYYDYEIEADNDGLWILRGEASRFESPRFSYRVDRGDDGRWRLTRRPFPGVSGRNTLAVPYHLVEEASVGAGSRTGKVLLGGAERVFEIASSRRPLEFRLDPAGEILADFHYVGDDPRRAALYRANAALLQGKPEGAEREFLIALDTSPASIPVGGRASSEDAREQRRRSTDADIRLSLATIYLDRWRLDEAGAMLDAVERLLRDEPVIHRVRRDALAGRLEIARGDHGAAYRRLKRMLKLAAPRRRADASRAVMWKARLGAEREALTEAYALFAIASHETGNEDDFRWALREARERGVDLDALVAEHPAGERP